MKKVKYIVSSLILIGTIVVISGYSNKNSSIENIIIESIEELNEKEVSTVENEPSQIMNMFVTHGHCSSPFSGRVEDLDIVLSERNDQGNPLENMKISFAVNPNTFKACRSEELTDRIKTPGLFINDNNDSFMFRSTNVYTMGIDWYQINGKLSIKGVEKDMKFFATGIRDTNESMSKILILEGKIDLLDWEIDYDKILTGKSDKIPTKWMHLNMKIDLI